MSFCCSRKSRFFDDSSFVRHRVENAHEMPRAMYVEDAYECDCCYGEKDRVGALVEYDPEPVPHSEVFDCSLVDSMTERK